MKAVRDGLLGQISQEEIAEAHEFEGERWTRLVTAIDEAIDSEGS